MGDRAMAKIVTGSGSLYFYTHWHGSELPEHARLAVDKAKPRIGDDPYATKIVFDSLIHSSGARDKETGAGILLQPDAEDEHNNDKPSVVIDLRDGTVTVHREVVGQWTAILPT